MSDINVETYSSLLSKFILITIEMNRLNALMVHYSDAGNKQKLVQTVDAIKRLEMSKTAIALELDRRMPNDSVGREIEL
jgi:hypothetical protein